MPVVLCEGDFTGDGFGFFEDLRKADPLHAIVGFDSGKLEDCRADVDGADDRLGHTDRNFTGAGDKEGGFDTAVVEAGFAAGKGATIVSHVDDIGVVFNALAF